jgi:hypothetical protein
MDELERMWKYSRISNLIIRLEFSTCDMRKEYEKKLKMRFIRRTYTFMSVDERTIEVVCSSKLRCDVFERCLKLAKEAENKGLSNP